MPTDIPELFIKQMEALLPDEAKQLTEALRSEPETSIRLNLQKSALDTKGEAVAWCDCGRYLADRPQFTFDPLLHAGAYYVQDASSMFIHHLLRHLVGNKDITYLDLCAAPGGKTTTALGALSDGSLVVANEIDRLRVQILRENVTKWGCRNAVVSCDTPRNLGHLHHFFDVIAADMPCSGEGMFRKDEEARAQWNPALVTQCAERQRQIADDIWNALKPGGLFIYSTCTFNLEENERMAEYIAETLGATCVEVPIANDWKIHPPIDSSCHGYRFMPHLTRGEGLFVAVLRKDGNPEDCRPAAKQQKQKPEKPLPSLTKIREMLRQPDDFDLTMEGDTIYAIPRAYTKAIQQIRKTANTLQAGIPMATVKGKDVVPSQAAAHSRQLSPDAFPKAEVDYPTAISYLRGETIGLPENTPKGYVLIFYQGLALGFVKNLGNRANNCYPREWRIRSSHTPSSIPEILNRQLNPS